ncbi:hypothetical protein ABE444_03800 [Brevundimonas pondensis]|uniref:Uncharacterized protein n=1 Tax=Brevundimonas pondensis TaxID=2774189 RepID=A0ABX7SFV0_9CAUL|nr:hypothetical protein [Brevundimonas pondensis]QTC86422.1 hypothetical protein IFE19_09590 [Brevundimonas pondensis]
MTSFIVRYSGRGTGVLRTETVAAENTPSAVALVKRRLGASQTFREARVFEDEELRFNVTAGRGGAVTSEERARL